MTPGYASGGAVAPQSANASAKPRRASGGAVKAPQRMEGGAVKARADKRARGGRTKHKGTTINIVNAGHPSSPPMAGVGLGSPPMMPPRPMAAPPSPAMATAPGGIAPPSMPPGASPIRSAGGRAYAKGGGVKSGPAWEEGVRDGTQPKNSPGKMDGKDVGRPRVITYKKGGAVEGRRLVQFYVGGAVKARASGGRIESPNGVDAHTKLPGGSGGAEARLAKEKRAKKEYHPKNRLES